MDITNELFEFISTLVDSLTRYAKASENPYQAPTSVETNPEAVDSALNAAEEKKFNQQIVALGGFWIFIGLLAAGLAGVAVFSDGPPLPFSAIGFTVIGFLGVLLIGIGVLTCMKKIAAVWIGLILSYVSIVGQLLLQNLCGLVIFVIVIAQAHRVISWSKKRNLPPS